MMPVSNLAAVPSRPCQMDETTAVNGKDIGFVLLQIAIRANDAPLGADNVRVLD